jgi:site-specific DNA-methyltransferase (adenine-specific)
MIERDAKQQNKEAMQYDTVLGAVPFLNEPTNADWRTAVKQLPSSCVDLVVTDPPYGMEFQSNYRKQKHKKIEGDNDLAWVGSWVEELKRLCKDEAHLYVFCSWHNVDIFKRELGAHFKVKNILIWEKNNTGMGDLEGDYAPKYEMCIFCSNGVKKLNGGRDSNILKARRTQNENHPTEKPVNLIRYLIEKSSQKGDIVLDTFAGSFSTARAAKEVQRDFLCFEIEPEYVERGRQLLFGTAPMLF